ncbi:MAG: methyl-accepting chemotaxis protein [Burkholderiaceae bacterium]|nr:methyl-accepting chemotaxis protein [Burkholderiaceae bacterium]
MKLGLKLLAAPFLTAVVVLIAGQVNTSVLSAQAQQSLAASRSSLENFKTMGSAQQQTAEVHAGVYRAVALIASMGDDRIQATRSGFGKQLAGVKAVVEHFAARSADDAVLQKDIGRVIALVDKYAKEVDSAVALAKEDPNTSVAALERSDVIFKEFTVLAASMTSRIESSTDAVITASTDEVRTISLTLALASVALGCLAVGMAWRMQTGIVTELSRAAEVADGVAHGDLRVDASTQRQDEVGGLMRALGAMATQLNQSISTVRDSSESVRLSSAEIASGNLDLSERTELTASNLQRAAASTEHLANAVRQSAEAAKHASQLAANAATVAARGGVVVSDVVATMEQINVSARKISDIIGVIDGIAFQTNILALNAAVEAARAGEQGRGFAVVASEVRSLAGRSAEAAKEIKNLIGVSVSTVENGSRLVATAGLTMTEIVGSVQRVSDIINEISAAAAEQSSDIGGVHSAVGELDQMTQQNAALVEQSAAAAESLREQAERLAQVVSTFKLTSTTVTLLR